MVDTGMLSNNMKSITPKVTWHSAARPYTVTLHWYDIIQTCDLVTELNLITEFHIFTKFGEVINNICKGWGMLMFRAHLPLRTPCRVPFGNCICFNVETSWYQNLSYFWALRFENLSVLLFTSISCLYRLSGTTWYRQGQKTNLIVSFLGNYKI